MWTGQGEWPAMFVMLLSMENKNKELVSIHQEAFFSLLAFYIISLYLSEANFDGMFKTV